MTAIDSVAPRMPQAPATPLPPGACDSHTHVFGPFDRFPLAQPSSYPLPMAPAALHAQMLDTVGAARGVLVQPAPYGSDPAPMLAALALSGGRLRGVGVADATISVAELTRWSEAGIRGLRFVEMRDPKGQRYAGSVDTTHLAALAPAMRALGMHAQLWASAADYQRLLPALLALEVPLVLDHMGCFDIARGPADAAFVHLLEGLRAGQVWIKLSLCRVSKQAPSYDDLRPFHDAMVAANPARLLWGSDWPFVRMGDNAPDAGALLDLLAAWVPDPAVRRQILVDNPALLYGFV